MSSKFSTFVFRELLDPLFVLILVNDAIFDIWMSVSEGGLCGTGYVQILGTKFCSVQK